MKTNAVVLAALCGTLSYTPSATHIGYIPGLKETSGGCLWNQITPVRHILNTDDEKYGRMVSDLEDRVVSTAGSGFLALEAGYTGQLDEFEDRPDIMLG